MKNNKADDYRLDKMENKTKIKGIALSNYNDIPSFFNNKIGLTTLESEKLIKKYGLNKIEDDKKN